MSSEVYFKVQQYIDGELDAVEEATIAKQVKEDANWQKAYTEILQLHELLQQDAELMEPPMRFTQNVMDDIKALPMARPASAYVSGRFFIGIMSFLGGLLALLIGYMLSQTNFFTSRQTATSSLPKITVPNVEWSFINNSQTLMITAGLVVIGLLVLADMVYSHRKKMTA